MKLFIVILSITLLAAGCNTDAVSQNSTITPQTLELDNRGEKMYSGDFERTDDPYTERSFAEYGDYDCADFTDQDEAQQFFEEQGGPEEDYHNLDRNGDGIVCESYEY